MIITIVFSVPNEIKPCRIKLLDQFVEAGNAHKPKHLSCRNADTSTNVCSELGAYHHMASKNLKESGYLLRLLLVYSRTENSQPISGQGRASALLLPNKQAPIFPILKNFLRFGAICIHHPDFRLVPVPIAIQRINNFVPIIRPFG